jgi:ribonuclease P protein component
VLARPNEDEVARLGIIVAKRFVKKAVFRNSIKRLIRESFRHQQNQLLGLDIVVLLRSAFSKAEQSKLLKVNLEKHWKELLKQWKNGKNG